MVAQQSVFTVHPKVAVGHSLEYLEPDELACYRLPKQVKWNLMRQLVNAGVTRALLFPGTDGLALGVMEASRQVPTISFSPPDSFFSFAGEEGGDRSKPRRIP
jgi:hypothetical protein